VSVLSEFSQAESAATPCAASNESEAGRVVLESFILKFGGGIYPVGSGYYELLELSFKSG
jgi:hypothetical protein